MFDDIGFRETGHKVSYWFGMGWVMVSTPCWISWWLTESGKWQWWGSVNVRV